MLTRWTWAEHTCLCLAEDGFVGEALAESSDPEQSEQAEESQLVLCQS